MTDLEICKRLAEIEGKEFYLLKSGEDTYPMIKVWKDAAFKDKCVTKHFFESHDYNPLTDDALCFQLMKKYRIDVNHAMFSDDTLHRYEAVNTITGKGWGLSKSLNKAICLAIIEANNEAK